MDPIESLNQLIAQEWELRLQEDPLFATSVGDTRYNDRLPEVSEAAEVRRAQAVLGFLSRLQDIDREALPPADQLNYDIFAWELNNRRREFEFQSYWLAIDRMNGPQSFLPYMVDLSPFHTLTDYQHYLTRLRAVPAYLAAITARLQGGVQRGMVPARPAVAGAEDGLRGLAHGAVKDSPFYAPFLTLPAGVPAAKRADLQAAGREAVQQAVMPAFQALAEYVQTSYLPATRDTVSVSALPRGAEYYRFLVEQFTTQSVTPRQVHDIGRAEVSRIRAEMQAVIDATDFNGSFDEFLAFLRSDPRFYAATSDDLLKTVALLMKRMDGELPRLFSVLPRTPYGIKAVPDTIAPTQTTAYYFPATGDGSTAGFYYVNTYDLPSRPLYEIEALSLHEAVPGHHLQIALQQEMQAVPNFRRYCMVTSYVEGWALYSERLGLEVGFYQDPYSNFGRLTYEMWRACRLVVDTGLHALGWSRQQAINFMAENTALSLLNIQNEVDRYIAWPGQALAYKMGELKIRALRAQAEETLAERFDLREFHRVLLEDGPVPLDLLEKKIVAWIDHGVQPARHAD